MFTPAILETALVALICFNVAMLAVHLLRKRAVAHKNLLKMAAALQTWGLKTIPDILTSIATGDWIQAEEDIKYWVRVFEGDPNSAVKELDAVLANVLAAQGLIAVKAPTRIEPQPAGPQGVVG